ncbi:MAG: hypothetical protein HUJ98_02545 [Bacteroidaceae bacterium]|nr:hypothetical protein [Bacteroidaceae bacterium]
MRKSEKGALFRVLTDLIKADAIIDAGEMEHYAVLKKKYSVTRENEIEGLKLTFSDALNCLSQSEDELKSTILTDCSEMTVSDGFCASSEALLMIAINKMLAIGDLEGVQVISTPKQKFDIADSSILYVESTFDKEVNGIIQSSYRLIFKESQIAGFNFIYIPKIIEHYRQTERSLMRSITSFLAPSISDEGIENIIDGLLSMSTESFCKDILCNKLGVPQLRNTEPALLIKIGHSYLEDEIFANYLKVPVDKGIVTTLQNTLDEYSDMLSSDIKVVPTAEEDSNQFLYHGFYKQLLDIFLIRKNVRSRIYINPYTEDITFPDIDSRLSKLHRREKALYLLLLIETTNGGVCFNQPTTTKQLDAYQRRMKSIQTKYDTIYGILGGDNHKAPDLSQAELRRPMLSLLKKSISEYASQLYNIGDYLIHKDDYGYLSINMEPELLYIYQSDSKSYVKLKESDIYSRIQSKK